MLRKCFFDPMIYIKNDQNLFNFLLPVEISEARRNFYRPSPCEYLAWVRGQMLPVEISTASEISTDPKFLKSDTSLITPLFPSFLTQKALILVPFESWWFCDFPKKMTKNAIFEMVMPLFCKKVTWNILSLKGTTEASFRVRMMGKRGVRDNLLDFQNFGSAEISTLPEISAGNK